MGTARINNIRKTLQMQFRLKLVEQKKKVEAVMMQIDRKSDSFIIHRIQLPTVVKQASTPCSNYMHE